MCNINILINKHKDSRIHKNYIGSFIDATATSFASNSDAEGIYISSKKHLIVESNRLDLWNYLNDMANSDFLLDHTRISTSGYGKKNHQPFKKGHLIIGHNGMLSFKKEMATAEKSDTAIFVDLLDKRLKELGNIPKAIKKVLAEDVSSGSYSIFIYDEKDECMYYFKNNSTSMNAYENGSIVFMSTSSGNGIFFAYKGIEKKTIKSNALYEFRHKNNLLDITESELPVTTRYATQGRLYGDDYGYDNDYYGYGGQYSHGHSYRKSDNVGFLQKYSTTSKPKLETKSKWKAVSMSKKKEITTVNKFENFLYDVSDIVETSYGTPLRVLSRWHDGDGEKIYRCINISVTSNPPLNYFEEELQPNQIDLDLKVNDVFGINTNEYYSVENIIADDDDDANTVYYCRDLDNNIHAVFKKSELYYDYEAILIDDGSGEDKVAEDDEQQLKLIEGGYNEK